MQGQSTALLSPALLLSSLLLSLSVVFSIIVDYIDLPMEKLFYFTGGRGAWLRV